MQRSAKSAGAAVKKEIAAGAKEGAEEAAKYYNSLDKTIRTGAAKAEQEIRKSAKGWSTDMQKEISFVQKAFQDLSKQQIVDEASAQKAIRSVHDLGNEVDRLRRGARDQIEIFDLDNIQKASRSMGKVLDDVTKRHEFELGFDKADRQLAQFERNLRKNLKKAVDGFGDDLSDEMRSIQNRIRDLDDKIKVGLDSSEARKELASLNAALKKQATLEVNVDGSAKALAAMKMVQSAAKDLNRDVDIDVNVHGAAAAAGQLATVSRLARGTSGSLSAMNTTSRDSANAFRAFNGVLLAAVSLGPALVPVLAAVTGGLVGLSGAAAGAGGGLGVLVLGFSGVKDAVEAMGEAETNAAKDTLAAEKTMRSAARGVEDAQRSLARARAAGAEQIADAERSLTRAIEDGGRRQADAVDRVRDARRRAAEAVRVAIATEKQAEQNLASAKRASRVAEQELADARRQAALDQLELRARLAGAKLDVRQARLDVGDAQLDYNAVMADGSSTAVEREQASINLERAKLAFEDAKRQNKELADEKKKSDRQGVEGSDRVKTAQQQLTDAIREQKEAQKELGQASKEIDRARKEGAEGIRDALEAQADAQRETAQAIADARRNLAQAETGAAQSVGDAQRGLTRAQQDYQTALTETGEIGSASMQKLEEAMGKLSPAGRNFAAFLFGLRDEFYALRNIAQEGFLPALQQELTQLGAAYGPSLKVFVAETSDVLAGLFRSTGSALTGPIMKDFFGTFGAMIPRFLELFGETGIVWMQILGRFLTLATPMIERMGEGFLRISEAILEWTMSREGTDMILGFFAYAEKVGPKVLGFFMALVGALVNLGRALAPIGEAVLWALTGFLNFIAGMEPGTLRAIVVPIIALLLAMQVMTGLTAGFVAFTSAWTSFKLVLTAARVVLFNLRVAWMILNATFLASPLGWIVLAIGAVVVAIVLLWKHCAWFRDAVKTVWAAIGAGVNWLWKNVIQPVFNAWVKIFQWVWQRVSSIWNNQLWPIFRIIGIVVWKLWTGYLKAVFGAFVDLFRFVGDVVKWVWRNVLKPAFEGLGNSVRAIWRSWIKPALQAFADWMAKDGFLQKTIRGGIEVIKTLWNGLKAIISAPIRFALDVVLNKGIIGGFRWLGEKVGIKEKDLPQPFKIPKALQFNRGGVPHANDLNVYPGYTPGRDTGIIAVGGGEAIMRPEWTRALGTDTIERWNAAARRGGVKAVQRELGIQAFATGGIAGGKKKRRVKPAVGGYGSYPGHTGIDINIPGPSDYGNPVVSADYGRVVDIQRWNKSYGNHVWVDHNGTRAVYAHLSAISAKIGQALEPGHRIGKVGSTGNSTGPHLHFEVRPGGTPTAALAFLRGAAGAPGPGTGGGDGFWAQVGSGIKQIGKKVAGYLQAPLEWAKDRIAEPVKEFAEKYGKDNFLVQAAKSGFDKALGWGVAWLKDKVKLGEPERDSIPNLPGQFTDIVVASKKNQEIVREVAKKYGWASGKQWQSLRALVSAESSFRNTADNPTSTAYGLFQFLDSTWKGYGPKTDDPRKQAEYGLKYIDNRYGTPAKAWGFHQANGWYSEGGVVPGGGEGEGPAAPAAPAMMYDNGGYLPPGLTTVVNLTGKPEPVFTDQQWRALESSGGGTGGGEQLSLSFHGTDMKPGDVVDAVRHAQRTARLGGKNNRRR